MRRRMAGHLKVMPDVQMGLRRRQRETRQCMCWRFLISSSVLCRHIPTFWLSDGEKCMIVCVCVCVCVSICSVLRMCHRVCMCIVPGVPVLNGLYLLFHKCMIERVYFNFCLRSGTRYVGVPSDAVPAGTVLVYRYLGAGCKILTKKLDNRCQ